MIAKSANLFEQEVESCRMAIIGMACFIKPALDLSEFWQNQFQLSGNENILFANQSYYGSNNSLLLKAADTALDDAGISEDLRGKKRTSIVISPDANPLSGLKTALLQLENDKPDLVLLLLTDIEKQSDNSDCLGAFVLKRLDKAIEDKDCIYASPILLHDQQNASSLATLKTIYQEKKIQPASIGLLTLATVGASAAPADSTLEDFTRWFAEAKSQLTASTDAIPAWCSLRHHTYERNNGAVNSVALLIETILTIQQRVLLPSAHLESQSTQSTQPTKPDLWQSPFCINASPRPWFHHQFPHQFIQPDINMPDQSSVRRAALHIVGENGGFYHLLLEEYQDAGEAKRKDFKSDWQSEVFTLFADSRQQLVGYVQLIKEYLFAHNSANLKDIAFTINSWTKNQIEKSLRQNRSLYNGSLSKQPIKVAFVCVSVDDLQSKLQQIISDNSPSSADIYWNSDSLTAQDIAQGKLAFVLPGLGAAYPNMLADMCLHFPEVRAIFDFVDHLATLSGNKIMPSDRIFPRQHMDGKSDVETPASLAVMDSAVVTVLLAEWAIFNLLLNLAITPDILLGCSTGEFAVLTMSGAIDILKAAPVFYHLSTGVSQSLPMDQLFKLRSLKINAAFEDIDQELAEHKGKIHLSADLSPKQLIVTGARESINILAKSLEEKNISADFLPFAIPYHTSLVAGVVSDEIPEVQELQIDSPLIESWSCSLAQEYPASPSQIRKFTTELFSKPILFRKSVEALYAKGVRKFIEVGPRGSLTPVISETLAQRPHISIAANRSDVPALTQLNHVLATLFVNDLYMDLTYLYQRRSPILLPMFDNPNKSIVKSAEIKNIEAKNIGQDQLLASFQSRLSELQKNVISAIKAESIKEQSAVAVMEQSYASKTQKAIFLSEQISLSEIFKSTPDDHSLKNVACRLMYETQLPQEDIELSVNLINVLSPTEIKVFQSFRQPHKRRQWLTGRIAIKEAVRDLLYKIDRLVLSNTDIEIASLESGKIYISKIHATYPCPAISLSHKDGQILAVAADSARYAGIGIDLESTALVDESLSEFILSAQEQKYIKYLPNPEKNVAAKKIWAAKEAAAKALGLGLPDVLKNLSIIECNENMNQFSIQASSQDSNNQTVRLNSYVVSLENMILAFSFLPV